MQCVGDFTKVFNFSNAHAVAVQTHQGLATRIDKTLTSHMTDGVIGITHARGIGEATATLLIATFVASATRAL